MNIHSIARPNNKKGAPDEWRFDLSTIDALKLDNGAGKILGVHRGGAWFVLSEDVNMWDKLHEAWKKARNPFPEGGL